MDFTDFFNIDVFSFSLTNGYLLSRWCKECGMVYTTSHAVGSERRRHNTFDIIDEIFENFNSISNIFEEPHDF